MLAYWHIDILGGLADWQIAIYIQSPAKTCVHSGRGEGFGDGRAREGIRIREGSWTLVIEVVSS